MIRSMTGYGQGAVEVRGTRFQVDVRSVNHRFLDLKLRLPGAFQSLEKDIQRLVRERCARGRVEVAFTVTRLEEEGEIRLNDGQVAALMKAAGRLRDEFGLEGDLDVGSVLRTPGIFREPGEKPEPDQAERDGALAAAGKALDSLLQDRLREGGNLAEEIVGRLGGMTGLVDELVEHAGRVPEETRARLEDRLQRLAAGLELDPARLAQEAVMLADRSDITEELVRLRSHLDQASRLLSRPDGEPVGKRLDFLMQEIHRETNTINSKSSDLTISNWALSLKTEGDKVREQIQNLE